MSGQSNRDIQPVALVTGATSGIGRAVALRLAGDGFYVIVHGRDLRRGSATVEEIESNGGHGRFVAADLSIPSDVERLAADVGNVDVLVNNAGFVVRTDSRSGHWDVRRIIREQRACHIFLGGGTCAGDG